MASRSSIPYGRLVEFCDSVNRLLGGGDLDGTVGLMVGILRGFDTKIEGNVVSKCQDDCNPMSVCVAIGSIGQVVEGVVPADDDPL